MPKNNHTSPTEKQLNELLDRGTVTVIDKQRLRTRLREGKPLNVKLGIDPTGPDIHLGHAVVLRKLRQFQELGHQVTIIIGDWTARIGDPTDRNEMRPQLTAKQVEANAKKYLAQLFLVLDKKKTNVVKQSTWFKKFTLQHVFDLLSKFSVAQLLDRDDIKTRLADGVPVGYHEPIYALLQAYDSVAIKADLELGATEQLFNLLKGRELQQLDGQRPQEIMTMEILVGLDGKQKMGKSLNNYIALLDSARDMYGKVMSLADEQIIPYFTLATDLPYAEISKMKRQLDDGTLHPRDAKMQLAKEIVTLYHSAAAATRAENEFVKQFQKRELPSDIRECDVKPWPKTLRELLVATKLASSNSEATRLVRDGGVRIDGAVVKDPHASIKTNTTGILLQRGKRHVCRVFNR